jgi:RHS repeat-associated protein
MVPGTTKLYVNNYAGNSIIPVTFRTTTATAVPTNTYNADGERCWSAMSPTTGTCAASAPAGATSYGWNSLGQMCWSGPTTNTAAGCSSPPAGTTTYTYDGQGLRMKATPSSGTASSFTWDTVTGGGDPLDIDDGTNAYVYGPTGTAPVEQINISTGAVSYLTSGSSGVQAVISSAGSLQEEAEYSTYGGQVLLAGSKAATPFGFQGTYTDASGLDYMINRYYTPTTDQFLSVDPDLSQTGQPYAFTGDDPLNLTDPLGLVPGKFYWNNTTWNKYQGTTYTKLCVGNQTHCGGPSCHGGPCYPAPPKPSPHTAFEEMLYFNALTQWIHEVNAAAQAFYAAEHPAPTLVHSVVHAVSTAVDDVTSISTNVTTIEHWYGSESQSPPIRWLSTNRAASCTIQGIDLAGATLLSGGGDAIYLFGRGFLSAGASNAIAGSGGFLAGCGSTPTPENW